MHNYPYNQIQMNKAILYKFLSSTLTTSGINGITQI